MIDLFVITGEPSGDAQGAKLVGELLKQRPSLKIGAVAGPKMRSHKIESFFPMENLQVMGFIDVFLALPKILRQFFAIRNKILELRPKAVLFIDYPGFNLRMQRSLRKKGFTGKLIQFVCPSVWAWGKKRIPMMAKHLDLLFTLFPFEAACFKETKLPVKFVGHPLAASIASFVPAYAFRKKYRFGEDEKILAIFPGSRKKEIERNLPLQLLAAKRLLSLDPKIRIGISIAHTAFESEIRTLIGPFGGSASVSLIPPEEAYDLMKAAWLAVATSGTVTLELALHGTPTVVNFAIRPLDCFIAQKIFRINLPFYCIVNILLSKSVLPELFGPHFTSDKLFFWMAKMGFDNSFRNTCIKGLIEVRKSLEMNNTIKDSTEGLLSCMDF